MNDGTPPFITGSPWPGVCYLSTTRAGGISTGDYATFNLGLHVGDDPHCVVENRRRLRAHLPAAPLWLQQVHGVDVIDADAPGMNPHAAPCADAAITGEPRRVLAILTADCLPVILGDVDGQVAGIAHAGWRGLAHGILENTLTHLAQRYPKARAWRAWIGPAIGPDAFEVGRDVFDAFVTRQAEAHAYFQPADKPQSPHKHPDKWFADLPGIATLRLRTAGVENVQWCGQCTFSDPAHYFSYRYRASTGRMVTCAWLSDSQCV